VPSTRTTTKLESAFEDDVALSSGTVVAGRYRVIETLGSGAMGTVYLAEHLAIGRRVAVKVLASNWSHTADVTRRFRAEARAASAIGHPNIVEVLDADELPDGRPFIVMEYLKGRDLLALLRSLGTVPWQRVCQIASRIAHALHVAHEIGIVHRDLKAENVMLVEGPQGEVVKVLDFGIAVNITDGAERATRPGIAVGTPEYMAPEQARGDTPTPSIDVYAAGVLMFELLVGEPPFTAANPLEILGRKAVSPAPKVASRRDDIPEELAQLVDSCLAMEPEDRPKSARELGERLDAILEGSKELARLVPVAIEPPKRGVEPWAVALVSALVLGTAIVIAWPSDDRDDVVATVEPAPEVVAPEIVPEPAPLAPPVTPPPAAPPEILDESAVAIVEPADPERSNGKRRGKTKRAVLPSVTPRDEPAPADDEACVRTRREAEQARQAHDWHGILRHTDKAACWPSSATRKKLRVKANMELNRFEECVRLGKDSGDSEVVGWVRMCSKRLDSKAAAEDG
jgi:serine/threonine protein kinase